MLGGSPPRPDDLKLLRGPDRPDRRNFRRMRARGTRYGNIIATNERIPGLLIGRRWLTRRGSRGKEGGRWWKVGVRWVNCGGSRRIHFRVDDVYIGMVLGYERLEGCVFS